MTLFLKLAAFPAIIATLAWWASQKDPKLGVAAILPPLIVLGSAVANNVIVAPKKVEKTAKKVFKFA